MSKLFTRTILHAATNTMLVQALATSNNSTGADYTEFKTDVQLSKGALIEMAEEKLKRDKRFFANSGQLAKHINECVASFNKSQDEIASRQAVFAELAKGMGFTDSE